MRLSPVVWSLLQQFGRQGINLAVFVLLATLLAPREIGVLGAATVWMGLALVFTELGLGAALVQRPTITAAHLSSTFALNAILGFGLALVGFAGAGWFAQWMGVSDAAPVLRALALVFVTDSLSVTQIALAQRELRFRDLAIRDIGASLIGGAAGVAAALLGYGIWSIVALALVTSIAEVLLIWTLSPWRPRLVECSRAAISDLWGYSALIFAFGVFKQAVQNLDKLIVGATLGPVALGLYVFAYRLVVTPASSFVGAVGAYLFPKFARMQDNALGVRTALLFVLRALVTLLLPALAAAALLAPLVIPAVFGAEWVDAAPLVQLLAAVAALQTLISPSGQLMKALNRPAWLFAWSVGFAIITSLALGLGSLGGITGVGMGLIFAHILGLPVIHTINRRLTGLHMAEVLEALAPACLASLALIGLGWAALGVVALPLVPATAIGLVLSLLVYALLLLALDRPLLLLLLKGIRKA